MKMITHIWRYLTEARYRHWVDFCTQQENVNRSMNLIIDRLNKAAHPIFLVEEGERITAIITDLDD